MNEQSSKPNPRIPNVFVASIITINIIVLWYLTIFLKRLIFSSLPPFAFKALGVINSIAITVVMILVLVIFQYDLKETFRFYKLKANYFLPTIVMILGVIILTISIESFLYRATVIDSPISFVEFVNDGGILSWIISAVSMVVFAPILQGLLFRGLLQSSLQTKYNPPLSIIIPSVVFCLFALVPKSVIIILITCLAYGLMVYRTRSIFAGIAMHSLYNIWLIAYNILFYRGIVPRIHEISIIITMILFLISIPMITYSFKLARSKSDKVGRVPQ